MKPFQFKKFTINQSTNVFRVGTDGVLLGVLSTVEHANKILEVGTGTGLISLMIAQRNPTSDILAIDLNREAVDLARENFENSPFQKQLKVQHQDFKDFSSEERYDLIISNPPYFQENSSSKDIVARQQTELTFESLIQKSAGLLSAKGLLSVIIPFESGNYFESRGLEYELCLSRKIKIFGINNAAPKRWILEFSRTEGEILETEFVIEKSPRTYSDEYLELTKEFHQFSK